MNSQLVKILFALIISLIAVHAMVMPMIRDLFSLIKLKKVGRFTQGVIIDFIEKEGADSSRVYAKIINFTTESNEDVVFESKEFFYIKPKIGKLIEVLHDTQNPNIAVENYITTCVFKWFLIFLACGIILTINIFVWLEIF